MSTSPQPEPPWPPTDTDPTPGTVAIPGSQYRSSHLEVTDAITRRAEQHVDAIVVRWLSPEPNSNVSVGELVEELTNRRPWDYDTAAADALLAHADALRSAAQDVARNDEVAAGGHSPTSLVAVAARLSNLAEAVAERGGFSLSPATAPEATSTPSAHRAESQASASPEIHTASELPANDEDAPAEHALLASMIHCPTTTEEISKVLLGEDFTSLRLAAVFHAVQVLAADDRLIDCAAAGSSDERLAAAQTNYAAVLAQLRRQRSHGMPVLGDSRLLADITAAAPVHAGNFDRLHSPDSQLANARIVLEQSARRQIADAGITMHRVGRAALLPGTELRRPTDRAEAILADLDDVAARLARSTGEATHQPHRPLASLRTESLPSPLSGVAAAFSVRAERDLIQLAMRGNAAALQFHPDDFSNRRNANTWRAIQDLHARGATINHVTIYHACRTLPLANRDTLNARQLERLNSQQLPDVRRINHVVRTISHSAVHRATKQFRDTTRSLLADTGASAETQISQVRTAQTLLSETTRRLEGISPASRTTR